MMSSSSTGDQEVRDNDLSSGDPYYAAQNEIEDTVRKAVYLFQKWRAQLVTNGGAYNSTTGRSSNSLKLLEDELVPELRQITFDLEDIKTTIQVVEKNPTRFQVTPAQLQQRKRFLEETTKTVQGIQNTLAQQISSSPQTSHVSSATSTNLHARNRTFMDSHSNHHQVLLQQQDEQLEELALSADRLHQTAVVINEELEDQQRMLTELDEDIDREAERMSFVMRRMSRLLKTTDTRQLCLVLWLVLIVIVLFFLVVVT